MAHDSETAAVGVPHVGRSRAIRTVVSGVCCRWRVQLLAMGAVILGAKLWFICVFAGPAPYLDQWDGEAAWLFKPYLEGTLPIGALLAPFGEHRFLWPRLLSLLLLEFNGRWDPIIEMIFAALVHVAALAGLVGLLGAALGAVERLILAITTAVLFALPFGASNTLAGFQVWYFLPLFSLACFHYGVDAPSFSVRWWGAIALAVGAYFAMASGALTLLALIVVHALLAAVWQQCGWREYAAMALGIVIVVLMVNGIPTVVPHAPLAAHSLSQFASAFFVAMAWPLSEVARMPPRAGWDLLLKNLVAAVLVNLPVLAFVASRAKHLGTADRSVWIYLLIGLWTALQAASLAYGRAVSVLDSRYLDLLIINAILNVACLLRLMQANAGWPSRYAATAWGTAFALMVAVLSVFWIPREIREWWWPYTQQRAVNLSAFLATGDKTHLTEKPVRAIPYAASERLITLATDPTIRSILPEDIMPSSEARTRNPNLVLGGPLHNLFQALRKSLRYAGLSSLMIGSLVLLCASYVVPATFSRRTASG